MESKKISQLATELSPELSDLTIIGDPTTGISKKITLSQMASLFTGTVEEYATLAAFPLVGVADTIYIALDTNIIYRYDTSLSTYVILSPNIINSLVFSDANGFDGTITLVGSVATLSITTALTLGSVPFIGASGALSQDNANLFFDDTNNRLGIATASPTTPLDVFGSGIIGRLNATSTNNAYLGFASAGTNKWSVGNVQSDHRFRIFSEANAAELVSVLQTGEFGIGIANPTTKFHIDGGATALIANLDANVSVAKSVSFRSDNSARINLEVSGTESGSDAGADLFIRRYSDAGALLDTPFFIKRSSGNIGISTTSPNIGGYGTNSRVLTIQGVSGSYGILELTSNSANADGSAIGRLDFGSDGQDPNYKAISSIASFLSGSTSTRFGADLRFYTRANNAASGDPSERMRISRDGNFGINTGNDIVSTNLIGALTIKKSYSGDTSNSATTQDYYLNQSPLFLFGRNSGLTIVSNNNEEGEIIFANNSTRRYATIATGAGSSATGGDMYFKVGSNTERMRITSGGNVGIGTSSPDWPLTVKTDASANSIKIIGRTGGDNALAFYGSDASTLYGHIDVGASYFQIYTSNSQPMQFFTGGSERMRITSGGKVMVNTTDSGVNALLYASASSSEPYPLGSKATTSSQGLVGFFDSANALQGSISISGSTVSYNSFMGSHWSQLSDNSKSEILIGTILEAIDELCEWDNITDERLPKVKISDIVESKNVYGVFSNWDNTDDYNDMYVAAVGAGFIRVNSNEIVSMGDLLQSNGDGTAKIQSDDIMRSSTIAKVTSTQKINTYEDGSYLIAATLHCG